MRFPKTGKEMIPDSAWDDDNRPVQWPEKEALDCMPVFMYAEAAVLAWVFYAEENEDAQRQASTVSG